jgi:hypothetical protein
MLNFLNFSVKEKSSQFIFLTGSFKEIGLTRNGSLQRGGSIMGVGLSPPDTPLLFPRRKIRVFKSTMTVKPTHQKR